MIVGNDKKDCEKVKIAKDTANVEEMFNNQ